MTIYTRNEHLARLIGLWPKQIEDRRPRRVAANIVLLRKAVRHMASLAKGPHAWTYDINRHVALQDALRVELKLLRKPRVSHEVAYLQDAAKARRALKNGGAYPGRWDRRFSRAELLEAHRRAIAGARQERAFRLRERTLAEKAA